MTVLMKLISKRDNLQGDSAQPGRQGWFDVRSVFNFRSAPYISTNANRVEFLDFRVAMTVRRGIDRLFVYATEGRRVEQVILEYQTPKGSMWFQFDDVLVASFQPISNEVDGYLLEMNATSVISDVGRWPGRKG